VRQQDEVDAVPSDPSHPRVRHLRGPPLVLQELAQRSEPSMTGRWLRSDLDGQRICEIARKPVAVLVSRGAGGGEEREARIQPGAKVGDQVTDVLHLVAPGLRLENHDVLKHAIA
jgi:hypothetical protein